MSFSLSSVPKTAALTVWSGLAVGTTGTLLLVLEHRRRRITQVRCALRNAEIIRSSKQYHASDMLWDNDNAVTNKFDDIFSSAQPVRAEALHALDEAEDSDDPKPPAPPEQHGSDHDVAVQKVKKALTYPAAVRARRDSYHDWGRKHDQVETGQDQAEPVPSSVNPEPDELRPVEPKLVEPRPVESNPVDLVINPRAKPAVDQTTPETRRKLAVRDWKVHPDLCNQPPLKLPMGKPAGKGSRSKPSWSTPSTNPVPLPLDMDFDENMQLINNAADLGDKVNLDKAVVILRKTLREMDLTAGRRGSLVQAGIQLCLKCQQVGMIEQAMRALHSAIELGPMTEADYFAANPQPVIDYAVSVAEARIANVKDKGWKVSKIDRELLRTRMDRTIMLITPDLVEGTWSPARLPAWESVADKCVHLALDLGIMVQTAVDLYWSRTRYGAGFDGMIALGFMKHLHDIEHFRHLISTFHLHRRKLVLLDADTWFAMGDIFVDAVDKRVESDPAKALQHLVEFCPVESCSPEKPLRTTWVTKMLWCHWRRAGSFEQTYALFKEFAESGGFDKVVYKDGMYRTMIQIAVDAEQWDVLDDLRAKLIVVKPSAAKEARILGLTALAKARIGEWDAVWDDFKQMEVKDRLEAVFTPVLHEFIKTHTTKETEDFLKAYVQEIEVPISPIMVNMVANRYGDVRDYESFLEWLSWCCQQGFEVDAAFGNAIIHNCRRRWDCTFEQLRTIHRTLQALSPGFVDDAAENMTVNAGMTAHKKAKIPFLKKQVGFATRKFHRWTITESASNMRVDMRHAFLTRDYRKVLHLYRAATNSKSGALDEGHLRLAVQASLKLDHRKLSIKMIEEAKHRGMDVDRTVTMVFLLQLRLIFQGNDISDKDQLLRHVQACIGSFEQRGLSIGHHGLLRVAHQMLRARHHNAAIQLGLSALHSKGITHPDDIPTFQLFLVAYAYRADVQGMKWTLASAVHTQYYHKRAVAVALKDASKHLSKQIQSTAVKQAQWVVMEGLDLVRQRRIEMAQDRKHLEKYAMEIMARAALDAKEQPTCEDTIQKRNEMVVELAERAKREEEEHVRKAEEYRAIMQARKKAAEEQARLNQEEADAMEALVMANKHEIRGDF